MASDEMSQRVLEHDWQATPLGARTAWPQSLRTAVQMVLASPFPNIVLWGPQLIQIYNDGYKGIMGSKHPEGLGQPTRDCWPEVWHINEPIYRRVLQGESLSFENALYPVTRSGTLEDAWFTLSYSPIRDETDAIAGILVTVFETTRQVRAEDALQNSRARVQIAVDAADLATWDWDIPTDRVYWNDRHFRLFGMQPHPNPLTSEDFARHVHPDDREAVLAQLSETIANRTVFEAEFRAVREDGDVCWMSGYGRVTAERNGQPVRMSGVMFDITERKRAEEALHESEEKFRTLFETIDEGYVLSEVIFDENEKAVDILYLEANPTAIRLAGRDFTGRRMREIDPRYEAYWYEICGRVALTGEAVRAEQYAELHGRWFGFSFSKVGGPESRRIASVFQDITERKQAEAMLRESEQRFQAIANLVPDLLWESEPAGSTNWYNQRWLEYTGQSFEQAIGWGWTDAIHPDDKEGSARRYGEVVEAGQLLRQEHRIRRHDGEYRWFVVTTLPVKDENGQVVKVYGAATDIHDQHVLMEAVRESEEKYRTLFESVDEGFAVFDMLYNDAGEPTDFRYVETNPAFQRQAGRRPEPGQTMRELFPEAQDMWLNDYAEVARTRQSMRFVDYQEDLGCWFDVFVFPVYESGNRLAAIFSDVTERKRAEEALRRSEEKYRTLFESIDEGVAIVEVVPDEHGRVTDVVWQEANPGVERHTHMGGWVGKRASEIVPDLEPTWFDAMTGVYQTGESVRTEAYVAALDRWIDTYYSRIGGPGSPFIASVFQDITERKQRERQQEYLLKLSDALRPLADPQDIQKIATRVIGEQLNADRVFYTEMQPDERTTVIRDNYVKRGVLEFLSDVDVTAFGDVTRQLRSGQTVVLDDVNRDEFSDAEKAAYAANDLVAAVAVPLIKAERWVATLVVHSRTARQWTTNEVALVQETAERTWSAVERARAEASLRKSEERSAILVRFSDAARGLSEPQAVAEAACRLVAEALGVERAYWAEVDWATREYVVGAAFHLPNVPVIAGRFPLDAWEPFTSRHLAGQPVVVNDTQADAHIPAEVKAGYAQIAVGADLATPVVVDGRLRCTLAVNQRLPRHWSQEEVAFVGALAGRAWAEVERVRIEKALRESEELLRALLGNLPGGAAFVVDRDLRYLLAEGEALRAVGLTASDFVGKTLHEALPPEQVATHEARYRQAFSGEPFVIEHQTDDHIYLTRGTPLRGAQGDVYAALAVSYDITERKHAEEVLSESQERQGFLLKFSDALRAEPNADAIANRALRMLFEQMQLDRCYLTFYRLAEDRADFPYQVGNDNVPALPEMVRLSDFPDAFQQVLSQTVVIEDDFERRGLSEAEKRNSQGLGMRALLAATVRQGENNPLCSMAAVSGSPRRWTRGEIALIEELAERTWAAMQRAHSEEALRQSQARFQRLFTNNMVPMFLWTPEGDILDANDAFLDLIGYTRQDIEAGHCRWDALTPSDGRDHDLRAVADVMAHGFCTPYEKRFRHKDGHLVPFLVGAGVFDDNRFSGVCYAIDLTERERAQEALRESEERFRYFLTASSSIMYNLYRMSADWSQMYSLQGKGFLADTTEPSRTWFEGYIPDTDKVLVQTAIADAIREKKTFELEHRVIRADGSIGWTFSRAVPLLDAAGEIREWFGAASNITDRKRAEEALRESEARFRILSDSIPHVVWTNRADGAATYFNRRWYEYSGLSYEQSVGLGWQAIVHPDDALASVAVWQRALDTGEVFDVEYRLRRFDGSYRWFIGRNVPLKDSHGAIVEWFGSATDIEEIKQAQEAVRLALEAVGITNEELEERVRERTRELSRTNEELAQMNQMRQELLRKVVTAQEDEAARISRDLHDDTGQQVAALLLNLHNLKNRPALVQDPATQELLTHIEALAGEIAQKSHRISFTLRPTALEDQGLIAALRNYTDEWSRWSKLPVDFVSIGLDGIRPPKEIESTVYRVVQESLTNIMKYATGYGKATGVSVTLRRAGEELVTIVEDDGPGFDVEAVLNPQTGKRRLGLFGMQERARLAGGTLSIESAPGEGTAIYLRLPLTPAAQPGNHA